MVRFRTFSGMHSRIKVYGPLAFDEQGLQRAKPRLGAKVSKAIFISTDVTYGIMKGYVGSVIVCPEGFP
jgi:hypothetical protein